MRLLIFVLIFFSCATSKKTQIATTEPKITLPEFELQDADVRMPLQFLAADEMQGRNTGTIYTDIAASGSSPK
ncbi:MAG: hypothetical protein AAF960_24790 [Bacteroidota bacterium]